MRCGHCTAAITKKIAALDTSASVSANLDSRTVDVDTSCTISSVVEAIKISGYAAEPISS
ncbi:heavy-metal-associated domain-containing protein [Roseovarius phycicola]|uniref:heavy-metal-associated domain-containing protein n=1 Tax=Roseovarius phycicola TaxID=3080976 RepID=UPI003BAFA361